MKKIAFHIEKGGTGKTTMAGNVGYELRFYRKTILIDVDPQGSLTSWYHTADMQTDLSFVLQGKADLHAAIVPLRDNLDLLPTAAIGGELKRFTENRPVEADRAIGFLLSDLEASGYEMAVFDLGPGMSTLERSILSRMDEIIGVVAAEYFSADGLEVFEYELSEIRKTLRAGFTANKIVVNRFHMSYAQHKTYLKWFEGTPYHIFKVGQSTGISDSVPNHKSVFEYEPGNKNTTEIRHIAEALL